MQIAVADAAVRDGDFDLVRTELTWVITERQEFGSCCMGCKSLNLSHVLLRKPHWMVIGPAESPKHRSDLEGN
jgi:hypothetical protein